MHNESIVFIGEAMLELVNVDQKTLAKSFAGDVYNTSVYLKRAFPSLNASFLSAIGSDEISTEFMQLAKNEAIDMSLTAQSNTLHMGIYMVVNDEHGERSFIYWRNQSAARNMISSLSESQKSAAKQFKHLFLSGITLAILQPEERDAFWTFLRDIKAGGTKIIFDPNYRERLWASKEDAQQQMQQAFELSDWLMPGLEDFNDLYGLDTIEACIEFCASYNFEELVLKQGAESVHVVNSDGHHIIPIIASQNVVDTTSAGDAFNGVYIGARLHENSVTMAVKLANAAACEVIATPGAIMPKERFEACWAALHSLSKNTSNIL